MESYVKVSARRASSIDRTGPRRPVIGITVLRILRESEQPDTNSDPDTSLTVVQSSEYWFISPFTASATAFSSAIETGIIQDDPNDMDVYATRLRIYWQLLGLHDFNC